MIIPYLFLYRCTTSNKSTPSKNIVDQCEVREVLNILIAKLAEDLFSFTAQESMGLLEFPSEFEL